MITEFSLSSEHMHSALRHLSTLMEDDEKSTNELQPIQTLQNPQHLPKQQQELKANNRLELNPVSEFSASYSESEPNWNFEQSSQQQINSQSSQQEQQVKSQSQSHTQSQQSQSLNNNYLKYSTSSNATVDDPRVIARNGIEFPSISLAIPQQPQPNNIQHPTYNLPEDKPKHSSRSPLKSSNPSSTNQNNDNNIAQKKSRMPTITISTSPQSILATSSPLTNQQQLHSFSTKSAFAASSSTQHIQSQQSLRLFPSSNRQRPQAQTEIIPLENNDENQAIQIDTTRTNESTYIQQIKELVSRTKNQHESFNYDSAFSSLQRDSLEISQATHPERLATITSLLSPQKQQQSFVNSDQKSTTSTIPISASYYSGMDSVQQQQQQQQQSQQRQSHADSAQESVWNRLTQHARTKNQEMESRRIAESISAKRQREIDSTVVAIANSNRILAQRTEQYTPASKNWRALAKNKVDKLEQYSQIKRMQEQNIIELSRSTTPKKMSNTKSTLENAKAAVERLHAWQQQRDRKIDHQRLLQHKQQRHIESIQTTFTPNINNYNYVSTTTASNSSQQHHFPHNFSLASNYGNNNSNNNNNIYENSRMSTSTTPTKSRNVVINERDQQTNVVDRLYKRKADAELKKTERTSEIYREEYPFIPLTNQLPASTKSTFLNPTSRTPTSESQNRLSNPIISIITPLSTNIQLRQSQLSNQLGTRNTNRSKSPIQLKSVMNNNFESTQHNSRKNHTQSTTPNRQRNNNNNSSQKQQIIASATTNKIRTPSQLKNEQYSTQKEIQLVFRDNQTVSTKNNESIQNGKTHSPISRNTRSITMNEYSSSSKKSNNPEKENSSLISQQKFHVDHQQLTTSNFQTAATPKRRESERVRYSYNQFSQQNSLMTEPEFDAQEYYRETLSKNQFFQGPLLSKQRDDMTPPRASVSVHSVQVTFDTAQRSKSPIKRYSQQLPISSNEATTAAAAAAPVLQERTRTTIRREDPNFNQQLESLLSLIAKQPPLRIPKHAAGLL